MTITDITTRLDQYGVRYSGVQVDQTYHQEVDYTELYTLRQVADEKGRISRVRVLKEYGRCDVSYIHATLPNGKIVPVQLTGNLLCVWYRELKGELIAWAKAEGVFAKGLGLLDQSNWSVLG